MHYLISSKNKINYTYLSIEYCSILFISEVKEYRNVRERLYVDWWQINLPTPPHESYGHFKAEFKRFEFRVFLFLDWLQ